jgi:hypothetical protein
MHAELAGRNHLGDIGVAAKNNSETDLIETDVRTLTGFNWLSIGLICTVL